nr:hypothetical protein [Nonomuraea gerenzanensis]
MGQQVPVRIAVHHLAGSGPQATDLHTGAGVERLRACLELS